MTDRAQAVRKLLARWGGPAGLLLAAAAIGGVSGRLSAAPSAAAGAPSASHARNADLVLIPAGEVQIGDDAAPPDERPAFRYRSPAFLMDRTPVTVAQFRAFVAETRYVTDAERFGSAGVLNKADGGWTALKGATWRRPTGPTGPAALENHPVTQVSWRDAEAFCRAYGARLPTEEEWERAARLGQTADGHVFKAGDPIRKGDHFQANVWQGLFPFEDTGADGYTSTSPVGAFGAAPSGLTDMAGNVWEWTASWYVPYGAPDREPAGGGERVQRGGSFLCDPSFCDGFRVTARGHSTPDTSLMHVGFRCVADLKDVSPRAGRRTLPRADKI
ncbi:formylglycine-generating enzyme family protein [Phenylobacterium sp.]|jgi:sulfatase modifying factor 1|uniref:formylglycine-generating enzyme family protein n=1 Tax=Phenylobacterium sp. TaxID=1871053 RepID=UPI002F4000C7